MQKVEENPRPPVRAASYIAAARTYLGTPYHHLARVRGAGVDCIGLIVCAAKDIGIDLGHADLASYSPRTRATDLMQRLGRCAEEIKLPDAKPGDLAVFVWKTHVGHLGILSDIGLVHTNSLLRKVTEHRMAGEWIDLLRAAYRIRGIEADERSKVAQWPC